MPHKDNKKEYCVYIHKTPSGKRYVGVTSYEPEKRWRNGKNYKSSRYFYNAIKKYGWENIEHEIIATGLTWEEASKKECELILLFKSNDTRYGYNRTTGGEDGFHHDPKTLEKISSASKKAWKNPNRIITSKNAMRERWNSLSLEEKKKFSDLAKERWKNDEYIQKIKEGQQKYNNDPIHREEQSKRAKALWQNQDHIDKIRKRMRGGNNPSAKIVCQYSLSGDLLNVYDNCRKAATVVGLKTNTGIVACAHGRQKTAGGYVWRYADANEPTL